MFNAVKLGLNPDPVFGEIYFIPYSGKLTYQIGYKGMIKLSMNSGYVTDVRSDRVFEKDTWEFYEDEKGQHYKFIPNFAAGKDRGKELFVYSVFQKIDGTCSCHIMESYHVDEIKKLSLSRTPKSPWGNDLFEPEMRKKTCIRRHWKNQPKSVEIARAIESEESIERGEILKQQHPELEGIIDEFIDKNNGSQQDESVLPVFDQPRMRQPGED
jgi:recombination protein RecT